MSWTAVAVYSVFALGAVGLYFMLPRRGDAKAGAGAVLAGAALLGLLLVCGIQLATAESANVLFYLFSIIALGATARVVTHPKPVYSAIYFVLVVVTVAAMMILLEAEFLAIAVIIIYAGAILVTYVFVIMLAQQGGAPATDLRAREPFLAVCAGFLTMAAVAGRAVEFSPSEPRASARVAEVSSSKPRASVRVAEVSSSEPRASARVAEVSSSEPRASARAEVQLSGRAKLADAQHAAQDAPDAARSGAPDGSARESAAGGDAAATGGAASGRDRPTPAEWRGNSFQIGAAVMTRYVVALEIAALLLLIAMVGAVILARKRVPVEGVVEPPRAPGEIGREVPPY